VEEVHSQAHDDDFRSSLEALDEAFFRMSAVRDARGRLVDFQYVYCNQAALRLLNRRREDVSGQHLLELFPLHRTSGLFDAYARVTETGEPLHFEFAFEDNGVAGDFEVFVNRLNDGYVLVGHDISERKRREREQAALTEQLQGALTSRVAIEQAKGYLAAMSGSDPSMAFEVIRRYARDHNLRLRDVAHRVVAGELDPSSDENVG